MANIVDIQEVSLQGFQVVKGEMFAPVYARVDISMTIWNDSINFSKATVASLNNCERIRIEVNSEDRCILIIPVTASDRDSVRWTSKALNPRKIKCERFTVQLYQNWGWDFGNTYKTHGRMVSVDGKVMILFDFHLPKAWKAGQGSIRGMQNG